MAKGPEGPSGSATSQIIDAENIAKIVGEIALPVPAEVDGEVLPRGAGTLAFCNSAGLAATRVCLMNIDAAQSRIDNGFEPEEVAVEVRSLAKQAMLQNSAFGDKSACAHYCRLAFTKYCELATGEIRSRNGSVSRPITDGETLDLIGVDVSKGKNKTTPEGRQVFWYFYESVMGEGNGYLPVKITLHSANAKFAESYFFQWLKSRRPNNKVKKIEWVKEEQLRLDI